MATPGKVTKKEKKKPVPVKTSLNNPYDLKWKPLEKGHARFILKTVTDKLGSLDLRKRHVQVFRKWRSKKRSKKENLGSVDTSEPTQDSQEPGCSDSVVSAKPTQESKKQSCLKSTDTSEPTHDSKKQIRSNSTDSPKPTHDLKKQISSISTATAESTQESKTQGCSDSMYTAEPIQQTQDRGWTNKNLRNELAIGINEVTKGLEKNELSLVLVCDSVKPTHMTSHLISLSQTRSVPACQVPGLSASLAGSLGLSSVLALGFKRQSGAFADTIEALAPKVPPLGVAWVPTGTGVPEEGVVQVIGGTDEPGSGRKRKLEDSPEVQKDQVTLLQPLKVKKIIPNPTKIRKPKIKKVKQK